MNPNVQDQRGTGLSSGISSIRLASMGTAEEQAQYLRCFRADSIVRDAEAIRSALRAKSDKGPTRWSLLGQSFGGFCCVTYLSLFPEGEARAM